jgi:hypothetical protein
MKIYLLIHEDRHSDAYHLLFANRAKALADAEQRARDMAVHYHVPYVPIFSEVTSDHWIFRFAVEDVGLIRVEEKEVVE